MSSRRGHLRLRSGAAAVALTLCGALVATALGFVDVYVNPLTKRGQYRQIEAVNPGKRCERNFVQERGVMEVHVKSGPKLCSYKAPVQGDAARPDHRLDAQGRIRKSTAERIRDEAFLSISVRVGGGRRYELRVFPKGKRFSLRRQPDGAGFPMSGSDGAVGAIGELNKLRLTVVDDNLKAHVNGKKVAELIDANSNQIDGRKVELGIGSRSGSKKNTDGNFDRLKLSVPNP